MTAAPLAATPSATLPETSLTRTFIDTATHTRAVAWPARLPRTLVIPETTLWFNLEAVSYTHLTLPTSDLV